MLKQLYRFFNPRFQTIFLDYKVDFKPRYGFGKKANPYLLDIIQSNRSIFSDFNSKILKYSAQLQSIKKSNDEKESVNPTWNNGFLPGLDIAAIYTMLAEYKPKKYVEVGSGNSTKVVYKAKKDNNLPTEIISIDPYPRAEIDHLADKIIRLPFENIDIEFLDNLEENDILFIDNSHRILPNSDAMVFFMEALPRLKKGVIVHVHDVYLPYDYPQDMCDRAYSEQYGLAILLLANPKKYKTIYPCYFVSEDKELSDQLMPLWNHDNLKGVERHGGSFWFVLGD